VEPGKHFYLRDKKIDAFQADIQQIKIIKPGRLSQRPVSSGATLAVDCWM
jgi:hypothetical protein